MGTTIALLLPTHAAAVGVIVARSLFAAWEDRLSRFRPTSELSDLNRRAGTPVTVSPLLYQRLDRSSRRRVRDRRPFRPIHAATDGALGL